MIKETKKVNTKSNEVYTEYTLEDCTVEQLRNMLNDLIGEGKADMTISIGGCSLAYIHNLNDETLLFDDEDLDDVICDLIDEEEDNE